MLHFKGTRFAVVAFLGGMVEGWAYLVSTPQGYAVLKSFKNPEVAAIHSKIFKLLEKRRESAARLLDEDLPQGALLISYERGLVGSDVLTVEKNFLLPSGFYENFRILHARFQNQMMIRVGEEVNRLARAESGSSLSVDPKNSFFRPHGDNVIYQPETDRWVLIDPH
jgi:hypothetical protein